MDRALFPDSFTKRLSQFSIVAKTGRLGQQKGTHQSRKIGASLDFSDYREYHPGDDLRHIDWNVYARTEKPFIKRFLDEQEMRIHILLDPTKSMMVDGKWDYARQLTIAMGHIALNSGDTVSISSWSAQQKYFLRRKGFNQRVALTKFVSSLNPGGVTGGFAENAVRNLPKATTVLFIITDGLEDLEKWEHLFKRLPAVCREVRIVVVQSKEELNPTVEGDIRFIDVESESEVEVTVTRQSIDRFLTRKTTHFKKIFTLAKKYGISLVHSEVEEGVIDTVTKRFRLAGWIR